MRWLLLSGPIIWIVVMIFWYLWLRRSGKTIPPVARVDVRTESGGSWEYETKVRLFDKNLFASDEWWPLGSFASGSEAAAAIQRFHGDRVTPESWCAFFDENGKPSVVHLGTLHSQGRSAQNSL